MLNLKNNVETLSEQMVSMKEGKVDRAYKGRWIERIKEGKVDRAYKGKEKVSMQRRRK